MRSTTALGSVIQRTSRTRLSDLERRFFIVFQGEVLREMREATGATQKAVAKDMGTSATTISLMETGVRTRVTMDMFVSLTLYYGETPSYAFARVLEKYEERARMIREAEERENQDNK